MPTTKVFFCVALTLLIFGATVDAKCNECSSVSYAACLNETAFKICYDGITPSDQIAVCPDNQVCTTKQGVCKSRDDATVKPDCGACKICASGFACISQTQFEYCATSNGIVQLTGISGKCPDAHYCSIENLLLSHSICGSSCTRLPTCYAAEYVPTPAPEPDYSQICVGKQEKEYYENIYDSTCKAYVYCEVLDGKMYSILFTCTTGYFSATEKKCTATKPSRCA